MIWPDKFDLVSDSLVNPIREWRACRKKPGRLRIGSSGADNSGLAPVQTISACKQNLHTEYAEKAAYKRGSCAADISRHGNKGKHTNFCPRPPPRFFFPKASVFCKGCNWDILEKNPIEIGKTGQSFEPVKSTELSSFAVPSIHELRRTVSERRA